MTTEQNDASVYEHKVMTVRGWVKPEELGITDAHNHIWIEAVPGVPAGLPRLDNQATILEELIDYRQTGGCSIVDCQPGGCGRNGHKLLELSKASGVHVIASTGFHRRQYYPPDYWLFKASTDQASDLFMTAIETSLVEASQAPECVHAGMIKVACEARLEDSPLALLEAAAEASRRTGTAIAIHTEKGSQAERILEFFAQRGVDPRRLVICHIDKRPDAGLHRELAIAGALLEYDTFFRPKYEPEKNVWPLLEKLTNEGLVSSIALATDMAEADQWSRLGNGPGLAGFVIIIRSRLFRMGLPEVTIDRLTGGNIADRLARQTGSTSLLH
jgi:phosphotriesterase-related protein